MADLLQNMKAGLGIAVTLVGMLMAASTGIVAATVVSIGLLGFILDLIEICPSLATWLPNLIA